MKADLKFFEDKEQVIVAGLAKYGRQSGILSFLRLVSFLAAAGLIIGGVVVQNPLLYIAGALVFILFVVLCFIHGGIISKVEYLNELSKVNSSYKARIKGDFSELRNIAVKNLRRAEDIGLAKTRLYGKDFDEPSHDYCTDLDLFGKKSLFSLLNVSETSFGRRRFADSLLRPHVSDITVDALKARQGAVAELCSKPDVLMDYQATARCGKMTKDPKALMDFAENGSKTSALGNALGIFGCAVWLAVPVVLLAAPEFISAAIIACIIVNFVIFAVGHALNARYIKASEGMPTQVKTILKLYSILENAGFENELINSLIKGEDSSQVTTALLKKLDKALRLVGLRSQPLFALAWNLIAPLDYLISYLLGNWAVEYGKSLPGYINSLAELESLMCAAQTGLVFANSTFPSFVESDKPSENAVFEGEDLAHPLLDHETVVSNSITIDKDIAVITGSNMSGKTTMIRTVGVCTVIALTGGLVPASKLTLGRMRVMSSMRIVDSLEENMSTFKAELIRISGIVNAANEERPLMFLIDEIFRGTNSDDRTEGALTVLKKLSKPYICGLMTTHDYAMIDKTREGFDNIRYYHFSESYSDTGISFDYKLSSGISRQSNARFLMKLVGIE
ncbi:MAG: hypothetical protein IKH20_04275 [Clostridiales bacterium]|nr:hypothetical protein [Clostridiales bacterium]